MTYVFNKKGMFLGETDMHMGEHQVSMKVEFGVMLLQDKDWQ